MKFFDFLHDTLVARPILDEWRISNKHLDRIASAMEGPKIPEQEITAVEIDDYGPERVTGEIVKLAPNHIGIKQVSAKLGDIAIHFPRLGFQVEAA